MYNSLGEICTLIFSSVLLFNTISSFSLKESRHLHFFCCILGVLLSTVTNIFSIHFIENFNPEKIRISTIITTTYFTFLGLTPAFFTLYCYDFVSPYKRHKKIFIFILFVPFLIYLTTIILNPVLKLIFYYDSILGYVRGKLKNITYFTTFVYMILTECVVLINRKELSKRIKIVFIIYPILGFSISLMQFFSVYWVMSGTSSFATLLLIYLSIQSDLLEYDIKTGLLTEKHLTRLIAKKLRGTFTLISLENFSQLEGDLGLYKIDKLIIKIASSLSNSFGRSVFQLSGTRFAVITKDNKNVRKKIEEIFENFEGFTSDNGSSHRIEYIAATIEVPLNAENYEQAMNLTNDLLAKARRAKGQKFICCDTDYLTELVRIKAITEILERELTPESTQFQVYFQPIYSVKDKKFLYAEALSRLIGTEIGDISPQEFVEIAETKGLIERLGNIVFEKVCQFIQSNKSTIHAVSVNFSVYQMLNPNIVDYVLSTINRYQINPSNIIIEITESIFIKDFDMIKNHMLNLSKAGIVFYLDDFGTGYSNFANVIALPFSTIKFDRSFVLSMEQNENAFNLAINLIQTFKHSGLKILVEGIENQKQDEMIKKAETDFIQGYLYSKPVPAPDYLKIMSN